MPPPKTDMGEIMGKDDKMKEILSEHRRWLPPSPHREKIAETIVDGTAHILARGHNQAPLLVFQDGGSMELPTVRWAETDRGRQLVSVAEESSPDQTRHRDVCGSVDEFKRLIKEDPQSPVLPRLLDDIGYMLSRMEKRRQEGRQFAAEVAQVAQAPVRGPEQAELPQELLPRLRAYLGQDADKLAEDLDQICEWAEAIRDVAQNTEYALTDYKIMAIRINELFEQLRGGRNWDEISKDETPPG